MSESAYDLIIQHHTSVEPVDRLVRDLLILLDKEGDPYIEYKLSEALLFPESKTPVLENLGKDEAEYYQKRFREYMVETQVCSSEPLSLSDPIITPEFNGIHTCPACGHQQLRSSSGMNTCGNCNLVAEKYERQTKREDIIAKENNRYKIQEERLLREALERARVDEEERLRREARQQLGLERKKRPLDIAIGVTAITLMTIAGVLIVTTMQRHEERQLVADQENAITNSKLTSHALKDSTQIEKTKQIAQAPPADQESSLAAVSTLTAPSKPITPETISSLKQQLQGLAPTQYFIKNNNEGFKKDQKKLARLLDLDKPELAIAFANTIKDTYAATLLLLEILESEIRKNRSSNNSDILRTFNTLASQAPIDQQSLVSANLSLMYRLLNDHANAEATLKPVLNDLKSMDNALLLATDKNLSGSAYAQKLGIILQILKDHQRFNQLADTQVLIEAAEAISTKTPADPLTQAETMTLLASAYLVLNEATKAEICINKILDQTTRSALLEQLKQL